ncbi:transposase [Pontibacter sp. 13R65]|uniref:transposase n=1 Tax=Pontibacter sp. 13R65 TaxID=3127458 RepID=UPI0039C8E0CC
MYSLEMCFRGFSALLKEMYNIHISHDTLHALTKKIVPQMKEWQARPLDPLYCIVLLNTVHYRVRQLERTVSRAA